MATKWNASWEEDKDTQSTDASILKKQGLFKYYEEMDDLKPASQGEFGIFYLFS